MKNLTADNFIKYITLIFLFLFPFVGMYFFHKRIVTLIAVIIILIIFLSIIIINKKARKKSKYLFLYYVICGIYLLISYIHSKSFITLIPNEYSLLNESLAILKLVIPITFLFSLYYQNISKKEYSFIIKWWIILIAGSIVVSNILKISLGSYSNTIISYNLFEWDKHIYYLYTASKGFFTYANQVGVILLMLLMLSIYLVIFERKRNIFYVILIALAMLMLGTRVSSLGGLISLICMLVFYLIHSLFYKNKIKGRLFLFLIPIGMWIFILPISPFANRNIELNASPVLSGNIEIIPDEIQSEVVIEQNIDKEEKLETSEDELNKQEYILNNYNPDFLPMFFFITYYPMQYDEDFWYEFIKNTPAEKMNYRLIEHKIIKRMIEINDNDNDSLFGMSNNRIQNVVNLERDLILHYYSFGIIGSIILLFVYAFSFIMFVKKTIIEQSYYNYIKLTCLVLFLFAAFLTGNIINSLFPSICLIIILMANIEAPKTKKL